METGSGSRYELTIPYPPSVNSLYRVFKNRSILSKAGRVYRADVIASVLSQPDRPVKLKGRLHVEFHLYMPDRRRRDISNTIKALEDSLTKAGVWLDDEQIDRELIVRAGCMPPDGAVIVKIEEIQ
jgi:crossover junction endodeoxyribonuclease RusA